MDMTRVLVLSGGDSDEREVSLRSGKAVAAALQDAGYDVVTAEARDAAASLSGVDVVFPALHGKGGEDGQIQKLLESRGLPFVGSDSVASELCFNKWNWRKLVSQYKVPISDGTIVTLENVHGQPLVGNPFVLKPFDGGSSIDTFVIRDPVSADWSKIESSFSRHPEMLVEALAPGTEITVTILNLAALPVIEIVPPAQGEYDYENKYNNDDTKLLCPPQHVGSDVQQSAQELALRIHKLCGCRDLSRSDMIVSPSGVITVLETNTMPGMTDHSLVPLAARTTGVSMTMLCDRLVKMALARAES